MNEPRVRQHLGVTAAALALAAALAFAPAAQAAFEITYAAADLVDSEPGEDLWQYDYFVSGHDFEEFEFFEILFPKTFYTELAPAPAPGWDLLVFADDPFFSDASFTATALGPTSGPQTFSVAFVWLGEELTPGSQQFTLFGADAGIATTGFTAPAGDIEAIPEPDTALLLAAGAVLAGAVGWRRRCGQVPART